MPLNGIERLIGTTDRFNKRELRFAQADEVTWSKWRGAPSAQLWQLVALHSSIDPDVLGFSWRDILRNKLRPRLVDRFIDYEGLKPPQVVSLEDLFFKNISTVAEAFRKPNLSASELKVEEIESNMIPVDNFIVWLSRNILPVVEGVPLRVPEVEVPVPGPWTWGSHTTRKLDALAAAG